jgi:hypothetical protein
LEGFLLERLLFGKRRVIKYTLPRSTFVGNDESGEQTFSKKAVSFRLSDEVNLCSSDKTETAILECVRSVVFCGILKWLAVVKVEEEPGDIVCFVALEERGEFLEGKVVSGIGRGRLRAGDESPGRRAGEDVNEFLEGQVIREELEKFLFCESKRIFSLDALLVGVVEGVEEFGDFPHRSALSYGRWADKEQEHVAEVRAGEVAVVDAALESGGYRPIPREIKEDVRRLEG